ncbi:MAG: hypothetical protein PHV68_03340 [Candidatus Gastranaerophilales bacterium]|nr:hypothetical protein [Candidatus Gastranaerophilales bacterium]
MKNDKLEKTFINIISFLVILTIGLLTLSVYSYSFKKYTISTIKAYCTGETLNKVN